MHVKDLKGKRIAVIAGTTTEQGLARALSAAEAPATLVPVKDGAEGMALLTQNKVDGYAGDRVVLAGLRLRARAPESFEIISEDFSFEPYALVLPRNDADFRLAVNTRARGPLPHRRHRPDLPALARQSRQARNAAALDVLPEYAAGVIMAPSTFVAEVARAAFAASVSLAAALVDAQMTPPPIAPSSNGKAAAAAATPPGDDCGQCGRVLSIKQTTEKEQWTPLGTNTGFQQDARAATQFKIGPGLSNQGKVIVGAAGGAGYQKTPNSYEKPRWDVTVKLDSGQMRVVQLTYEPYVQEGDRVRISGRNVELLN